MSILGLPIMWAIEVNIRVFAEKVMKSLCISATFSFGRATMQKGCATKENLNEYFKRQ